MQIIETMWIAKLFFNDDKGIRYTIASSSILY